MEPSSTKDNYGDLIETSLATILNCHQRTGLGVLVSGRLGRSFLLDTYQWKRIQSCTIRIETNWAIIISTTSNILILPT